MNLLEEALFGLCEHFLALAQQPRRTHPAETLGQGLPSDPLTPRALPYPPLQTALQIVQPLQPILDATPRMSPFEAIGRVGQNMAFVFQLMTNKFAQAPTGFGHKLAAGKYAFGDDLGGSAWGGGTEIGDKIADG